jgi:hypothetical protein
VVITVLGGEHHRDQPRRPALVHPACDPPTQGRVLDELELLRTLPAVRSDTMRHAAAVLPIRAAVAPDLTRHHPFVPSDQLADRRIRQLQLQPGLDRGPVLAAQSPTLHRPG